jgi:hypothetical protein
MKTINCITLQHKSVIDTLKKKKIYTADIKRVAENLRQPYNLMMQVYNYKNCPIFLSPEGYLVEMYGAQTKNVVAIELEIPTNELMLQNYYDWSDLIYFMEFPKEVNGNITEFINGTLKSPRIAKNTVCQCTTDRLKPEWLRDYTFEVDNILQAHHGSGGENRLRKLSWYVL